MAEQIDGSVLTLTTAEDIEPNRLVRHNSTGGAVYCDAGETPLGAGRVFAASGLPLGVNLLGGGGKMGTIKCVASAAIATARTRVYSAADGKISNTNTGVLIGTALNTASGNNSVVQVLPDIRNVVMVNVAASASIGASSTAEADFDKTFTIPASELVAGSVIRVRAQGILTGTAATTQCDIQLYAGTESIVTEVVAVGVANDVWEIDAEIVIRTIGASGTLVATTNTIFDAQSTPNVLATKASAVEDMTGGLTIKLSGQFDGSDGANAVRLDILSVQHLR